MPAEFIITGLRDAQRNIASIANVLDSDQLNQSLWNAGVDAKRIARMYVNSLVYETPESPNYRRTTFLRESIYLATSLRSDYDECRSTAMAAAAAVYPNRNVTKTYRMEPEYHPSRRSIYITAAAEYASYVEHGNGHIGPRPFMRMTRENIPQYVSSEIDRGVRTFLRVNAMRQNRTAGGQFAPGRRW